MLSAKDLIVEPSVLRAILLAAGVYSVTGISPEWARALLAPLAEARSIVGDSFIIRKAMREKMLCMLIGFLDYHGQPLVDGSELLAVAKEVNSLQLAEFSRFYDKAKQCGFTPLLIKGGDLMCGVYPSRIPRFMADLDILVSGAEALNAIKCFKELGFVQSAGYNSAALLPIPVEQLGGSIRYSQNGFELPTFCKVVRVSSIEPYARMIERWLTQQTGKGTRGRICIVGNRVYMPMCFGCHLNLNVGLEVADFWKNRRTVELANGGVYEAMSVETTFWYQAWKFYLELMRDNAASVRQFIDVLAVFQKFECVIVWDEVLRLAAKYSLQPAVRHVLVSVNCVLGNVPIELLCHHGDPVEGNFEYGDCFDRMFGTSLRRAEVLLGTR